MTEFWHETFPIRLDDVIAQPIPQDGPGAGATCILTADGSAPTAEELEEIEKFKTFLKLKQEIGQDAARAAVYGQGTESR